MSGPDAGFTVRFEPGGQQVRVAAGDNVLAAALAAGLPLPHSCRAGRCASCKAKLLAGEIAYPQDALPPGIVASEAVRGEVLLCQAQPRSDLVVQARHLAPLAPQFVKCALVSIERLSSGNIRVRVQGGLTTQARPGQYVDVRTGTGDEDRVAVTSVRDDQVDLESPYETLQSWLASGPPVGAPLWIAGPYDFPR